MPRFPLRGTCVRTYGCTNLSTRGLSVDLTREREGGARGILCASNEVHARRRVSRASSSHRTERCDVRPFSQRTRVETGGKERGGPEGRRLSCFGPFYTGDAASQRWCAVIAFFFSQPRHTLWYGHLSSYAVCEVLPGSGFFPSTENYKTAGGTLAPLLSILRSLGSTCCPRCRMCRPRGKYLIEIRFSVAEAGDGPRHANSAATAAARHRTVKFPVHVSRESAKSQRSPCKVCGCQGQAPQRDIPGKIESVLSLEHSSQRSQAEPQFHLLDRDEMVFWIFSSQQRAARPHHRHLFMPTHDKIQAKVRIPAHTSKSTEGVNDTGMVADAAVIVTTD